MNKKQTIQTEIKELLEKMINTFEVEVEEVDNIYQVTIKTEEASTIIGRRGGTIRAVQKILEVILYKKFGESVSLLVNINDYREKQKEKLEDLAKQFAEKTKEENRSCYLNDLNSFERRIVHEFISANYPDLKSFSIGEGREKKLVIDIKKDEEEVE